MIWNGQNIGYSDKFGDVFKNTGNRRAFTPDKIAQLFRAHPELRLAEDPVAKQLANALLKDPDDGDVQEAINAIINNRYQQFIDSGCDAFLGNFASSFKPPDDFIQMAQAPNGLPIGIIIRQMPRNIILSGLTGSGKTCLFMNMISNRKLLTTCRIIVFVRKRELRHLITRPDICDLIVVFTLEDLKIAFFQPPAGVADIDWVNETSRLTAQNYGIFSAHRLMNETGEKLVRHHPPFAYPTLAQIVDALEQYPPRDYFREGQYKSSILTCLKDLLICTKSVFSYSHSTFLDSLTSYPGLAIIEAPALDTKHLVLLASFIMRWLYLKRIHNG